MPQFGDVKLRCFVLAIVTPHAIAMFSSFWSASTRQLLTRTNAVGKQSRYFISKPFIFLHRCVIPSCVSFNETDLTQLLCKERNNAALSRLLCKFPSDLVNLLIAQTEFVFCRKLCMCWLMLALLNPCQVVLLAVSLVVIFRVHSSLSLSTHLPGQLNGLSSIWKSPGWKLLINRYHGLELFDICTDERNKIVSEICCISWVLISYTFKKRSIFFPTHRIPILRRRWN